MKPAPPVTIILIPNPSASAQVENRQLRQRIAVIRKWTVELLEQRQSFVFFRYDNVGCLEWPRKGSVRIIPANPAFARRRIIVGHLIQHDNVVFQRDKAVRKPGRNEKLFAVVA